MTREAINLSMSEPLRRAQVRQRLDALTKITDMAEAQLAGRALIIGLGIIESDLSQIFPGAAPTVANPSPAAPTAAPHDTAGHNDAQQSAASPRAEALPPAPPSDVEPEPAPLPQPALDATRRAEPPASAASPAARLGTQDAARALGYGSKDAFAQHVHRHIELKRCGRKSGNVWTWDLSKLRAEYERRGWTPK